MDRQTRSPAKIAGYSGTPLAKKLGIKAGSRVFSCGRCGARNLELFHSMLRAGLRLHPS
jgi:hypothetical protein